LTQLIVIGRSAVVMAVRDGEALVLTVRPLDEATGKASRLAGLPFGPFDPEGHRTFELALRAFVTAQTQFDLGYVEQLYTFGDKGRDAPLADVGAGGARVISVGYLGLTPLPVETTAPDTDWSSVWRYFPWEDWRGGRPDLIDAIIAPALRLWAQAGRGEESTQRHDRARDLFALDGANWNEDRVLDRYELLYEAGLAAESGRDRDRAWGLAAIQPATTSPAFGEPMLSDHRRILATALGRLRGKMKYRPVVFELTPPTFTLSELQRTVEAVAGVKLHKQNFRRMLDRTELVEGIGRFDVETGGRPAELFRFRRERLQNRSALGISLPLIREGT
jgi:hypothetical protein